MKTTKALGALTGALVALTLIACGGGDGGTKATPGGTPAPGVSAAAATATTVKLGQSLNLTSTLLGGTTRVTITVSEAKTRDKDEYGSRPEHGKFLTVKVAIVVTEGTYLANGFSFKVVAADGNVYENALTSIGVRLRSTELAAGQKSSGTVTFDVPASALKGGKIQVAGIGLDASEPAGYWKL